MKCKTGVRKECIINAADHKDCLCCTGKEEQKQDKKLKRGVVKHG